MVPADRFLHRRFGPLKIQETNFARVGVELSQTKDITVIVPRKQVTGVLQPPRRCGPRASVFSRWRSIAVADASWVNFVGSDGVAAGYLHPACQAGS